MGENYERYSVIDISVTLFGYEFSNIVENSSILKKHLSFAKNSIVIIWFLPIFHFKKTQLIDTTTKPEHIYWFLPECVERL